MYRFFTEHSDALATNGGWELSTDTWKDLVGQAGLDVRDIPQRLWDGYFGGLFPMFDRDKTTGLWTARDRKLHGAWLATGKVKVKRQKDSQRRRK
jgi:Leu/Phe-tRNA-protein transferase